jgi:hypothetical protein
MAAEEWALAASVFFPGLAAGLPEDLSAGLGRKRMEANASVAAEFNAFTVSQADPEWMHRPGREPTIPWRKFSPLSRLIDESYDSDAALRTTRHARAEAFQRSVLHKKFVQAIPVSN